MDIFRFKPNEPTGVRRLAGITAALNTILQGDPNASVLLLLNGRDVLTFFPVALITTPNLDLEELHGLACAPVCLTMRALEGRPSRGTMGGGVTWPPSAPVAHENVPGAREGNAPHREPFHLNGG
jgi:hypothetical protein